MRGLTYKNVSGYSKLALMTDTPEDWKKFLTSVGTGHDFDSRDLRTVPTQDLMAVLHPMLTDPELMFYLEYSGNVASKIYAEAIKFNDRLPRQSASYVVSSTAFNSTTVGSEIPDNVCSRRACVERSTQSFTNRLKTLTDNAVNIWQSMVNLKLYSYKLNVNAGNSLDVTESYKQYTKTREEIEVSAQDVLNTVKELNIAEPYAAESCKTINQFEDADGNLLNEIFAEIEAAYAATLMQIAADPLTNSISLAELAALPESIQQDLKQHHGTPDVLYDGPNSYTDAVQKFPAFIEEYFNYLKKQIKNYRVSDSNAKVVVRFYPNAATISEPLPVVRTTSLSENSFVQTVAPAMNLSVILQGNLAIDTPDTQWRELYANIFKIILSNGNPVCKARIGRYIVPNCYINAVSDFSNNHNTTPTFNFSLVSTEWDSAKLTPVNYVG